jgi:hypothetical protein
LNEYGLEDYILFIFNTPSQFKKLTAIGPSSGIILEQLSTACFLSGPLVIPKQFFESLE